MLKRNPRFLKKTSLALAALIFIQAVYPVMGFALTTGPTQPELQSFEPAGSTEMVDLFSGDFTYNIPLFEVPGPDGGYPVNLFYNSVTSGEEEASMVGLGWNIGIGAISRQMRGLPDDFNDEKITKTIDRKDNWTIRTGVELNVELFGADKEKLGLGNLSLGRDIMYNSYKGLGSAISVGIGIKLTPFGNSEGPSITPNFGFSSNSFEGNSINASVSVSSPTKDSKIFKGISGGLGVSFGSIQGLRVSQVSLSGDGGKELKKKYKKTTTRIGVSGTSVNFTQLLNYETPTFTPQVTQSTKGTNLLVGFKFGLSSAGLFGNVGFTGSFSNQKLINKNVPVEHNAYGSMYLQNSNARSLTDFNRHNDGAIRENQPVLPYSSGAADIFSAVGHGIGGLYRAYRSDLGTFSDQQASSFSSGGAVKIGIGASAQPHVGADVNVNGGSSFTRNVNIPNFQFQGKEDNSDFEPYYFKAAGEMNADLPDEEGDEDFKTLIGGDEPLTLSRSILGSDVYNFGNTLSRYNKQTGVLTNLETNSTSRSSRNPKVMSIQPITNGQLLDENREELLPEFDVQYYDHGDNLSTDINSYSNPVDLERVAAPPVLEGVSIPILLDAAEKDKIAGFTNVTTNGARWVFGLPVMNNLQREATFSVDAESSTSCVPTVDVPFSGNCEDLDTSIEYDRDVQRCEDYLSMTDIPAYAHSFLLTTVLGSDYVDRGEPGVDEEDDGYWMEIEYVKTSDSYKWRTPFAGATYLKGINNYDFDDKGSLIYGEREQFYPARIITKTHVAEFHYSERGDAKGAECWLQNEDDADLIGDSSYKLDNIVLYSKQEFETTENPIKTVHFEYAPSTSELCQDILNRDGSGGKLTLKKVWFTYEGNFRGELSPYQFEYNDNNPAYDKFDYDRWGVYQPKGEICGNINSPYVDQDEDILDANIGAWHLSRIVLPSGSDINIDVGRDHYSHVQDRVATRMFEIKGFGSNGNNQISKEKWSNDDDEFMRVYFDLEYPIAANLSIEEKQAELDKYFEDLYEYKKSGVTYKQLYFKLKSDVGNRDIFEDVTGYARILPNNYGAIDANGEEEGDLVTGYLILEPFPLKIGGKKYHPMLVSAWQFVRNYATDLMLEAQGLGGSAGVSEEGQANQVRSLKSMASGALDIFRSFYGNCRSKDFGRNIQLENSFIRLNDPDKKKFGGGVRVEKITLSTDWSEELTPNYGTVYEYETDEVVYDEATSSFVPTGNKISSGVAVNEPFVGSEENALKYVEHFEEDLRGRTDNLIAFEYPLNEAYYPGASVGYSKVTVKSLATDYALKQAEDSGASPDNTDYNGIPLPDGFATGGVTVNEFYTAKDFPIYSDKTFNQDRSNPLKYILIPLIGSIRNTHYYGTQGYTITLNDMHGKPSKITTYGQNSAGELLETPVSWVKYDYQFDEGVYNIGSKNRPIKRLNNNVTVISNDIAGASSVVETETEIGVEREVFLDARHSRNDQFMGGLDTNVDLLGLFPVPVPWPEVNDATTDVKTAVTNKIIRKSGILKKTTANDGQSTIITENLKFDALTGQALLTRVNNNFDAPIYNYSIPGRFAYEGMGPAYKNIGLSFRANIDAVNTDECNPDYLVLTGVDNNPGDFNNLITSGKIIPGDELIISRQETRIGIDYNPTSPILLRVNQPQAKAYVIRVDDNTNEIVIDLNVDVSEVITGSSEEERIFQIVRSGKRNHLGVNVGSIASLNNDPTIGRLNENQLVIVPSPEGDVNVSVDATKISNNVLSASAVTFSDTWDAELSCDDNIGRNPFELGTRGIWRPHKTYSYIEDRDYNTSPKQAEDGTFTDLVMFNWKNPFFQYHSDVDKWLQSNEVTKYAGNGEEVENKDILGRYSSALYGYEENLATAVAANARHYEIGFEGFEEYVYAEEDFTNGELFLQDTDFSPNGHLDFSVNATSKSTSETYNIIGNFSASTNSVYIDMPFEGNSNILEADVCLALINELGEEVRIENLSVSGVSTYSNPNNFTGQIFSEVSLDGFPQGNCAIGTSEKLSGKVIFNNCRTTDGDIICSGDSNLIVRYDPEYFLVDNDEWCSLNSHTANKKFRAWRISLDGNNLPPSSANCGSHSGTNVISSEIPFVDIETKIQLMNANDPFGNTWEVAEGTVSVIVSVPPTLYPERYGCQRDNVLDGECNAVNCTANLIPAGTFFSDSICRASVSIVNTISHSGKNSLKVSENVAFEQSSLQLTPNKEYVLSAWAFCPNVDSYTYGNEISVQIEGDNIPQTIIFNPTGPIIDGWQQIEGIFTYPGGNWFFALDVGIRETYFDDIRIFPKNGTIQTYVYDPQDYKVTEILDERNFFTRYIYNNEGSLIITKKETAEGVKTIQESTAYIKTATE